MGWNNPPKKKKKETLQKPHGQSQAKSAYATAPAMAARAAAGLLTAPVPLKGRSEDVGAMGVADAEGAEPTGGAGVMGSGAGVATGTSGWPSGASVTGGNGEPGISGAGAGTVTGTVTGGGGGGVTTTELVEWEV